MENRKFTIMTSDGVSTIADNMEIEIALLLLKSYFNEYFNEDRGLLLLPQSRKSSFNDEQTVVLG